MELSVDHEILNAYGFSSENTSITQIGSGHINTTYILSTAGRKERFVLQQLNNQVFTAPEVVSNNIKEVARYLKKTSPDYLFPAPLETLDGKLMVEHGGAYWRLLPYIENTIALDVLTEPVQAYEAAKQFGKLSRLLNDFDAGLLKPTIPGFHDLDWRFEQFHFALNFAQPELAAQAKREIDVALQYQFILAYYKSFEHRSDFSDRVMHHDCKISNVLLEDKTYKGICVIDLDTLMQGKFISDLGDMMRTYLSAFSENETDLDKIKIRLPFFTAMMNGYLSEMRDVLTDTEKELILFSGKYMVYMQSLRFLTDYLSGNIYYPVSYPQQNLDRARNQFKLLKELFDHERLLQDIIDESLS